MGVRARRVSVAVIALVSGAAIGASIAPTMSAWEDRGGSSMTITSIAEPPPAVTGPVTPGTDTTFTGPTWSGLNNTPNPTPTQACFTVVINTTSVALSPWTVEMHTLQPPFDNKPPLMGFQGQIFGDNASYVITFPEDYPTTGRVLVTPAQETQWASLTVSYTAKVCVVNTPEPVWQPPGPTTYTQRATLQLIRNGNQPCVAGTVDGHQPYYVGFTIAFNWKDFLDQQRAASAITQAEYDQWIRYTHWAGGPVGFFPSQGATGTDFQTTLQGYQVESRTVSNLAPVTIASCSY
jgi:hypothetical protein